MLILPQTAFNVALQSLARLLQKMRMERPLIQGSMWVDV